MAKLIRKKDVDTIMDKLKTIEGKLDKLDKLEEKITELESSIKKITDLECSIKEITKSQEFISKEYEKQRNAVDNIMKENVEMRNEVKNVYFQIEENKKRIADLEYNINDLEQYGRRSMLDIINIPKVEDQCTDNIVIKIGETINVDLKPEDIDASHRLSNLQNAGIIVKFVSRKKRDEFLEKAKKGCLSQSQGMKSGDIYTIYRPVSKS